MASFLNNLVDTVASDVYMFLDADSWSSLRACDQTIFEQLPVGRMQSMFSMQQQKRIEAALSAGQCFSTIEANSKGLMDMGTVIATAATMEVFTQVIEACKAHSSLVGSECEPIRQAVAAVYKVSMKDAELQTVKWTGKRSGIARALTKSFAGLSGLLESLVATIRDFRLPSDIFVPICEILTRLVRRACDKFAFVKAGGLSAVLETMRRGQDDWCIQSAGLGMLLALSARSVNCIELMVQGGAHLIIARALMSFSADTNVLNRATGLLANMSNVPCVCPVLQRCGFHIFAQKFLRHEIVSKDAGKTSTEFAKMLLANLEGY